MLLGISVPQQQPPPPRPTLVCRYQTVILVISTNHFLRKFDSIPYPQPHSPQIPACSFFSNPSRSGIVAGMVSNVQHYDYVTITNTAPYTMHGVVVDYLHTYCSNDYVNVVPTSEGYLLDESLAAGETWTASSRGVCRVSGIDASMYLSNGTLVNCFSYWSAVATAYLIFSIQMRGDDARCVLSSQETGGCPDLGPCYDYKMNFIC